MEEAVIVVKYGEIFLKSYPVRRRHERQLKENVKYAFKKAKLGATVSRERLRLVITLPKSKVEKACSILGRTFGISYFFVCEPAKSSSVKDIQAFARKKYKDWVPKGSTFAVRAKRSGAQEEKYTSMELGKIVGDVVSRKVDLTNPDVEIFLEVKDRDAFFYTRKMRGPGGLPVGSSGLVVCLLSGGIDSAVAAWLMLKRGCRLAALYADTGSYAGENAKSKKRVEKILAILQSWSVGQEIKLYSFNQSRNLDVYFKKKLDPRFVCLFCKRMMYRAANELAEKVGAKAVLTGESLGEVASQTLDNILVLDSASELPVFRPLIGNDKEENITIAKRIGTFGESVSFSDKCSAVPDQPRTAGKIEEIEDIESKLPMKKLLKESVASVKVE